MADAPTTSVVAFGVNTRRRHHRHSSGFLCRGGPPYHWSLDFSISPRRLLAAMKNTPVPKSRPRPAGWSCFRIRPFRRSKRHSSYKFWAAVLVRRDVNPVVMPLSATVATSPCRTWRSGLAGLRSAEPFSHEVKSTASLDLEADRSRCCPRFQNTARPRSVGGTLDDGIPGFGLRSPLQRRQRRRAGPQEVKLDGSNAAHLRLPFVLTSSDSNPRRKASVTKSSRFADSQQTNVARIALRRNRDGSCVWPLGLCGGRASRGADGGLNART